MLRTLPTQLRHDFGFTPTLVDAYVDHTPRADALRAARQVTGAGTYLSKIVTGEARMFENAVYAVTIVCMDEATDEIGVEMYPNGISAAIEGNPPEGPLEIIPLTLAVARDPAVRRPLTEIARWQDESRLQERDIGVHEIEKITYQKGGWSAVGHLRMMVESPDSETVEWANSFGFLMQLLDDYLDQPEDIEDGVSTMFTDGAFTEAMLDRKITEIMDDARELFDHEDAVDDFEKVCRLHKSIADVRNRTRFDPTRLIPWYL